MVNLHCALLYLTCRAIVGAMVGDEDVTVRMRAHIVQLQLQFVGIVPIVVIVTVADKLTATIFDTLRPVGTQSHVLFTQEESDDVGVLPAILLQHLTSVVGGAIVADDNLNVRIHFLREDAFYRLSHCIGTVV